MVRLVSITAAFWVAGWTGSCQGTAAQPPTVPRAYRSFRELSQLAAAATAPTMGDMARSLQATTNGTTVCPASDSPLAGVAQPVLTTACPSQCTDGLCVYYPVVTASSECFAVRAKTTCVRGPTCAFECIAQPGGETGWFLAPYTNETVLDEVAAFNVARPVRTVTAINASVVAGFVGALDPKVKIKYFYVSGDEPPNNYGNYDENAYLDDQKVFPVGTVVPFAVPASIWGSLQGVQKVKFENLRYNAPPPDLPLTLPGLKELFLRNALLTSVPLLNASLPILTVVDLSANRIREVPRFYASTVLQEVNLATNAITKLEPGLFPASILYLDLSSNPLTEVPTGTLPLTLITLRLSNTSLTKIPSDIANMSKLAGLRMEHTNLGTIPEKAIPVAEMVDLSFINCSLTAIPTIIKSMPNLGNLYLNDNDLSGVQNVSAISPSVKFLSLARTKLQAIPKDLQQLELQSLFLDGIPEAMKDLSNLPPTLLQLGLNDNNLTVVPSVVSKLSKLLSLTLRTNPIEKVSPGELPSALQDLTFGDAKFRALEPKTLPPSVTTLRITNSLLEQAPEDIRNMQKLKGVTMNNCQLSAFNVAAGLPALHTMRLAGNRITSFSGSYPAAAIIDLRNNSLQEFAVTNASNLTTLHLADNNLTSMPLAIFALPKLLALNLTRNPIRNFRPSTSQLEFLAKVPIIVMDQTMFAADCDAADAVRFRQFTVCKAAVEQTTVKDSASKGGSTALIVGNVCAGVVLIALGLLWWRRRKQQKKREKDLNSQTVSLEQQLLDDSIWRDEMLLQHRLDVSLVKRTRLLGSGASGEVWLATYRSEPVAVKALKQESIDVAQQFVAEVKLVLTMSHPRIVEIIGVVWTKESDLALVTEYMAGGDLRAHLDRNPRPPLAGWSAEKLRIALEITEAVVYLHSLDPIVIHRDLKSRNVLLDTDMHAKVTDFGISRLLVDDETMTADVGTMRWMAPEVLAGSRYDESADIYSLGIIFCEIDTHKLPFEGTMDETGNQLLGDAALATRLLSGALACTVSEWCPSEIRSLVEKCTTFDQLGRPTGLQVAHELRKLARVE